MRGRKLGIWGKENVREFDARSEVKEMGEKKRKMFVASIDP